MTYEILEGDCASMLSLLQPDKSVQMCVTSPPYFGLRDYGHDGQIGLEQTPEEYITRLVEVFREVRRVLKDDGALWLNIGDSYANTGGKSQPHRNSSGGFGGSDGNRTQAYAQAGGGFERANTVGGEVKPKDLIGIPWMLAFALRADGWYLRQDIIWHKPNPMPESVTDRCTKAHEYLFLFSKSPKYYFDNEAIKEPAVCGSRGSEFHTGKTAEHQSGRASTKPRESKKRGDFNGKTEALPGREAFRAVVEMRNRRSVWTVATKPYKGAHFATFPPALIEPCILAGSRAGDIVLDPFAGSGTTAQVAAQHGRLSLLCELNPSYIELIHQRMAK